jgi:hypothetical protein
VAPTFYPSLRDRSPLGGFSRGIRRPGIAAAAIASGHAVRMPKSSIAELRDVSRSMEVTGAVARRDRRAK